MKAIFIINKALIFFSTQSKRLIRLIYRSLNCVTFFRGWCHAMSNFFKRPNPTIRVSSPWPPRSNSQVLVAPEPSQCTFGSLRLAPPVRDLPPVTRLAVRNRGARHFSTSPWCAARTIPVCRGKCNSAGLARTDRLSSPVYSKT